MKLRLRRPKLSLAGLKSWAVLCVPTGMLALLTPASNFLSNRFEVSVQDLFLPFGLDLLMAGLVAAGFYRVWRRDRVAGLVAAGIVIIIFTTGYENRLTGILPFIQAVLPTPDLHGAMGPVASLVFMAIIFGGAYWAGRGVSHLTRRWSRQEVAMAIGIGITTTFAFLALPLTADLVAEWPQFFYKPPAFAAASTQAKAAAKPDIYYIVLDRYASEDILGQQFGYDNSDFLNFLGQNQYYVNPSAHNNYPFTTMSIASTMDGNYLNDAIAKFSGSPRQTVVPFNESIRNSAVARYLKSIGYRYDLIGNWYETSNLSPVADKVFQQTGRMTLFGFDITLNNFSKNILTQTPLWRFIQPGVQIGKFTVFSYTNLGDVDMDRYALQALRNEVSQPAGGRFIFAHILVPHDPYYFNADGSLSNNSGTDNTGALVKQKYINQVEYISSQMKGILSNINRASHEQAIVVLQSDEGPYPNQLNDEDFDENSVNDELKGGDMRGWSDLNLQMKFGNLAAYHIPRANLQTNPDAATAADPVNVFRLVSNTYFGASLPYLPDCYYAYPNGKDQPMRFSDITARLTGQAEDPRCLSDGRVKE